MKLHKILPLASIVSACTIVTPLVTSCTNTENCNISIIAPEPTVNKISIQQISETESRPVGTISGFAVKGCDISDLTVLVSTNAEELGAIRASLYGTNDNFGIKMVFNNYVTSYPGQYMVSIQIYDSNHHLVWISSDNQINIDSFVNEFEQSNFYGGESRGYQTGVYNVAENINLYDYEINVNVRDANWNDKTSLIFKSEGQYNEEFWFNPDYVQDLSIIFVENNKVIKTLQLDEESVQHDFTITREAILIHPQPTLISRLDKIIISGVKYADPCLKLTSKVRTMLYAASSDDIHNQMVDTVLDIKSYGYSKDIKLQPNDENEYSINTQLDFDNIRKFENQTLQFQIENNGQTGVPEVTFGLDKLQVYVNNELIKNDASDPFYEIMYDGEGQGQRTVGVKIAYDKLEEKWPYLDNCSLSFNHVTFSHDSTKAAKVSIEFRWVNPEI